MYKPSKIIFFNNYHNGDIHGSRGFVKNIMNLYGNSIEYEYHHLRGEDHLKDLSVKYVKNAILRDQFILKDNDLLLVNTHFGAKHNNTQFSSNGCNSNTSMKMLNAFYKEINIEKEETDEWNLVPEIDYSFCKTDSILDFVKNYKNKKILVCNGPIWSGQSSNFSLDEYVNMFSKKYPEYIFIVTAEIPESSNVISTNKIIKKDTGSDLNEISFLFKFCNLLIGKSSGPSTFSQTKETLDDVNKTMISFNNSKTDSYFSYLGKTKKLWSNNYHPDNIAHLIEEGILSIL